MTLRAEHGGGWVNRVAAKVRFAVLVLAVVWTAGLFGPCTTARAFESGASAAGAASGHCVLRSYDESDAATTKDRTVWIAAEASSCGYDKRAQPSRAAMALDSTTRRRACAAVLEDWPKGASGLQSPSLGAARVGDPAIQSERAYVSGFREIRKKAKAARAGDASAAAEIRAAKALREEGLNVHFRKAAGDQRGIRNVRTSDFLVGGEAGTGAGGIPYEVFSPVRGTSPGSIARTLRDKLHQADRFILDLTRNGLAPSDFSNIVYRINRMPKIPRRAQEVLFLQDEAIVGSTH